MFYYFIITLTFYLIQLIKRNGTATVYSIVFIIIIIIKITTDILISIKTNANVVVATVIIVKSILFAAEFNIRSAIEFIFACRVNIYMQIIAIVQILLRNLPRIIIAL